MVIAIGLWANMAKTVSGHWDIRLLCRILLCGASDHFFRLLLPLRAAAADDHINDDQCDQNEHNDDNGDAAEHYEHYPAGCAQRDRSNTVVHCESAQINSMTDAIRSVLYS